MDGYKNKVLQDTIISLRHIDKSFRNNKVVKDLSLDIMDGEFLTLLGPSGCGKTTILRMIAGFETPDSGEILLEDKDLLHVSPDKRQINTVFQSYALFPHLTVRNNIAYGMRMKKTPETEIRKRVDEMLAMTSLESLADRKPAQLSGGQQQRVAIARSLVNRPRVLLLDEPLGALDLQLRRQMQTELKNLQKKLKITYIYVTHDQEEAMTMSDRIIVMHDGGIEQIGSARELYQEPSSRFVSQFLGESNLFEGRYQERGGKYYFEMEGTEFEIPRLKDQASVISVRPEKIFLNRTEKGIPVKIRDCIFMGQIFHIAAVMPSGRICYVLSRNRYQEGGQAVLSFDPESVCGICI